jgi:hypothetical protein
MLSTSRLEVSEYSDILINQIDLKAETLLMDDEIDNEQRDAVNKKR